MASKEQAKRLVVGDQWQAQGMDFSIRDIDSHEFAWEMDLSGDNVAVFVDHPITLNGDKLRTIHILKRELLAMEPAEIVRRLVEDDALSQERAMMEKEPKAISHRGVPHGK